MLTLFSGLIQVQFLKHYQVQFMNSVTFFEPVEVFFDRSSVQFLNSILYIASKRRKQTQQNNKTTKQPLGAFQRKGDQKAATDVTFCHAMSRYTKTNNRKETICTTKSLMKENLKLICFLNIQNVTLKGFIK